MIVYTVNVTIHSGDRGGDRGVWDVGQLGRAMRSYLVRDPVAEFVLGNLKVVIRLEVSPELRTDSEVPCQPERRIGGTLSDQPSLWGARLSTVIPVFAAPQNASLAT